MLKKAPHFKTAMIATLVLGTTLLVTELSGHGDEGMRNWISLAERSLRNHSNDVSILRLGGDPRWAALLPESIRRLRGAKPDLIVYIPYSGLTSKALWRHSALRSTNRRALDVLVTLQADLQVRKLPLGQPPSLGAFASERLRRTHRTKVHQSFVFPPAVNLNRFHPSSESRQILRTRLGLAPDKPMVLHVGHLRPSRGLGPLAELAAQQRVSVTMLASTATEADPAIEACLRSSGVTVRREYVPAIERWYQAADVYLFPVLDEQGSIEIPLTVLEAMASGIPVAAAPFGGLPSLLPSTPSFRFAPDNALAEVAESLVGVDGTPNRTAVASMTESAFGTAFADAVHRSRGAP